MCDDGRLTTFKHVNAGDRLAAPLVRKDGNLVETGWDEAIAKAVSELRLFRKGEIAALGSAFATNEDNYLLQKFFRETVGAKMVDLVEHAVEGDQDDLLIRADKTPNTTGAREVGVRASASGEDMAAILKGIREGSIKALYIIEDDIAADPAIRETLGNLELLIVHAHQRNATTELADVVFAASTYAERNGTFVNFERHVQRIRPAVATMEQDRAMDGLNMSRWDKFASHNDRWGKGPRRDARPSWRIIAALAAVYGVKYRYQTAEDVFREITERVPSFKGLSYLALGSRGRRLATAGTPAPAYVA
jgi:NADH-quinone oxidoreductase subunit G